MDSEKYIVDVVNDRGQKIRRFSLLSENDAINKWIDAELEFWNFLEKDSRIDANIKNCWEQTKQSFQNIKDHLKNFHNFSNEPNKQDHFHKAIIEEFSRIYGQPWVFASTDPRSCYVKKLQSKSRGLGVYTFLAFINPAWIPERNSDAWKGFQLATAFDVRLGEGVADAEKQALDNVIKDWEEHIEKAEQNLSDLKNEFSEDIAALRVQREEDKKTFDATLEDTKQQFEEARKYYYEHLALLAPVEYWKNKATEHKEKSRIWAIAFGFSLVAFLFIMLAALHYLGFFLLDNESKEGLLVNPPYWKLLFLGGLGGLLVWPIRMLSRLVNSHSHLKVDAEERVTMVSTYLALLKEKQGLKEEDRALILQALFRPASTGMVKDDSVPFNVLNVLSRAISGEKR